MALRSSGPDPGSRGYPHDRLLEIIHAANATQSDVMFMFWSPAILNQVYARTDFEFQIVNLPPPTTECVDAYVSREDRCDPDPVVRRGSPEGACSFPTHTLQKVVAQSLLTISQNSPAYDVIKNNL